MAKPHARRNAVGAALALVFALAGCSAGGAGPSPAIAPSVSITVNGQSIAVPEGATVGQALQAAGVRVRSGRLLDVEGQVIRANEYPGRILMNGKRAGRAAIVAAGASIHVEHGRDRTEKTTEERHRVEGNRPENPQYRLGAAPGIEIIERGAISGKVASVRFEPTARGEIPKAVALTFDDGPSRPYTQRVLKILRKKNVTATFFVVGYLAERYPALIRKMVKQGHTVANHSWNHPIDQPFAQLEQNQLENQIVRPNDVLAELGVEPFLFRPPGGSYDASVIETARRNGMRIAMWSIGTDDWDADTTAREIREHVLRKLKPGAIVLMHDGGGNQSATVKALPGLINEIRKRGYELVAMTPNG